MNVENPEQKAEEQPQNGVAEYKDTYQGDVANFLAETISAKYGHNVSPETFDNNFFKRDENSNFWVAFKDGKVVGTVGLENRGKDIGFFGTYYVKEELRDKVGGKLVGGRLMQSLIKFAKEKGYRKLFGATSAENEEALSLYKKHGAKIVDEPPVPTEHEPGIKFIEYDLGEDM